MMIKYFEIKKAKKQVNITFENGEWARIWPFGGTFYTEVSDNLSKLTIRPLAAKINQSKYFREQKITTQNIKELEKEMQLWK